MVSDASFACLSAVPGHPLVSSADLGWTSLLVGLHRSDPSRTLHETSPTSDLTIGVAISGEHRLDVFDAGSWQTTHYGPGASGLTTPGDTDKLQWSSEEAFDTAHLYLPVTTLEEAAEELRRAGQRAAATSMSTLVGGDPMIAVTARSLLAGVKAGAPDLYAEQAARWLAIHLLVGHGSADDHFSQPRDYQLTDARLSRVVELMRARYAEPLSLETLASEAGMSKFHFARRFRERTGQPPHAFLTKVRMAVARRLLGDTDLPVARVAERSGYPRAEQFGIAFKRLHGTTPTEYRRLRHGSGRQQRA